MIDAAEFMHYGTIALVVAITSLGVGIGEGIATFGAIKALNIQPSAQSDIVRLSVLGMALVDTASIMGISIAVILLFGTQIPSYYGCLAELGIALAICIPGFCVGLLSALPAYQASLSVARQPFFAQKVLRFMLITQTLIQTPIIFGFIVAIYIRTQLDQVATLAQALKLIAAGLCIGLGSIGPSIGMAFFARTACAGVGLNRNAFNKLLTFTLVSEAIIETPIIFSLVTSVMIMFSNPHGHMELLTGIALISAALCTGLGTIGPGISSGRTAAAACDRIAHNPEHYSILSRTSMFGQGIIDTVAIYALVLSIFLIYSHS